MKSKVPFLSFANPVFAFTFLISSMVLAFIYQRHTSLPYWNDKLLQLTQWGTLIFIIHYLKSGDHLKNAVKKVENKMFLTFAQLKKLYNPERLLLGFGGPWGDAQRQIMYDVEVANKLEEFLYDFNDGEGQGKGNLLIHATVKSNEKPIYLDKTDRKGHMLISGATRSGKGVFAQQILNQLIMNKEEILIYMDPKNDNTVFDLLYTISKREGRPFYVFSPSYENSSLCYNPLEDIHSASDAADRIKAILPTAPGSEPWNILAFDILSEVIGGMMRIKMDISLENIYRCTFLDPDEFIKSFIVEMAHTINGKVNSEGETFYANEYLDDSDKLKKLFDKFPKECLSQVDRDTFDAVAKFRRDKGEKSFSERTQIFGSSLKALTEGPYKRLLSPDKNADRLTWPRIFKERAIVLFRMNVRKNRYATMGICKMFAKHLNYVSSHIEEKSAAGQWPYPSSMKINVIFDEAGAVLNDEMDSLYNMSASSGVWICTMVQTVSQIYGAVSKKEIADSIRGAHHHTLMLRNRDMIMAKETSQYYGTVRVSTKDVSRGSRAEEAKTTLGEDDVKYSETSKTATEKVNLIEIKDLAMQPTLQGFLEVNGTLYHVEIPIIQQKLENAVQGLGLVLSKGYKEEDISSSDEGNPLAEATNEPVEPDNFEENQAESASPEIIDSAEEQPTNESPTGENINAPPENKSKSKNTKKDKSKPEPKAQTSAVEPESVKSEEEKIEVAYAAKVEGPTQIVKNDQNNKPIIKKQAEPIKIEVKSDSASADGAIKLEPSQSGKKYPVKIDKIDVPPPKEPKKHHTVEGMDD